MKINTIHNEDCIDGMKKLPDECVDCIVTSPPYFGLRDYGVEGQIGLEETPEQFVQKLVIVFREARRVLKDDGTLWLNLGDSYAGSGKGSNSDGTIHVSALNAKQGTHKGTTEGIKKPQKAENIGLKPKDLIGIPWRVAFALQADGWWLRQDIIWQKPNPMPESVTDRCTKSHEYIFLLSKSQKYYYDHSSIMQECKNAEDDFRRMNQQTEANKSMPDNLKNGLRPKSWNGSSFDRGKTGEMMETRVGLRKSGNKGMKANKRSVWTVTTKPFKEAHFATFPEDLIVDCIKAGSRVNGIVLDPFMGAGTTALVARKLNRNYIGFELNPKYINIAQTRLHKELGMFI